MSEPSSDIDLDDDLAAAPVLTESKPTRKRGRPPKKAAREPVPTKPTVEKKATRRGGLRSAAVPGAKKPATHESPLDPQAPKTPAKRRRKVVKGRADKEYDADER